MTSSPILTVTLNPALDVTTSVARLHPQRKLRCSEALYHAGGGGVNVSRAIHELGGSSRAFVALAGSTGRHHVELLTAAGVECINWPIPGETRTSLTVMEQETGLHYRFVLPGPKQDRLEGEKILAEIGKLVVAGVRFVVASGSLPPGIDGDFYARLASLVRWHGAQLILDTQGAELRRALPGRPFLIRLNHIEARELAGAGAEEPIERLAARFVAEEAAEVVVIAMGERGSVVTTKQMQFTITPPEVQVHSMVGAGDSYVGALTLALSRGWTLEAANRFGVAAAASAVTREATQLCERSSTERLFNETGKARYAEPSRSATAGAG